MRVASGSTSTVWNIRKPPPLTPALDGRRLVLHHAERRAAVRALVERNARCEVPELVRVGVVREDGDAVDFERRDPSCSICVASI